MATIYKVVSNIRDYGEFTDKEEAKAYREALTEESSFNCNSNEYFWIVEE